MGLWRRAADGTGWSVLKATEGFQEDRGFV